MNIKKISLSNFMIFEGRHDFDFKKINVITGRNESGKSILAVDSLKYVLQKRTRFRKINDVINLNATNDDVFVSLLFKTDDNLHIGLKRYVNHQKYKQNIVVALLDENQETQTTNLINDLSDLSGVKSLRLKDALSVIGCHLEYFDTIGIFNPSKNILSDKNSILEALKLSFDSIDSIFRFVYSNFESTINAMSNDLESIYNRVMQFKNHSISNEEYKDLQGKMNEIDQRIKKGKEIEKNSSNYINKIGADISSLNATIKQHEALISKYIKFRETGKCFTCGRSFDGDSSKIIDEGIAKNQGAIEECRRKISDLQTTLNNAKNKHHVIQKRLWNLIEESKKITGRLSKRTGEIETLEKLLEDKKKELMDFETNFIKFKGIYDKIFSKENIDKYQKYTISQFENLYSEVYSILTDEYIDIELNLGKYDEPLFDGIFYSGLSTSKKRIVSLAMMLSLYLVKNMKLKTIILDEFFDVFDPYRSVKVIDGLFGNNLFNDIQFVITSNNEIVVDHIKSNYSGDTMTLINLVDHSGA